MGLKENLIRRGYDFVEFDTKEDAASYLCNACAGKTVALGGSVTLSEMGLYEGLQKSSVCFWHWKNDSLADARTASVYVTSANALAETGEIVNIDGNGNRVSSSIFGHETVYFMVGENKITSDLPSAWDRARNIAAPKNAARLGKNTPCAADGVCHDCQSPQCICSVITVHRRKPSSCNAVVILVHESLGY
ncbi:MAG: lactate utilization protein [Clostridia bacterium]|nr:lactate utilization protein [Clostridia bacterium]